MTVKSTTQFKQHFEKLSRTEKEAVLNALDQVVEKGDVDFWLHDFEVVTGLKHIFDFSPFEKMTIKKSFGEWWILFETEDPDFENITLIDIGKISESTYK